MYNYLWSLVVARLLGVPKTGSTLYTTKGGGYGMYKVIRRIGQRLAYGIMSH